MGRKPKTPLSNVATNSSTNNQNWESAKHACLDKKKLTKPPLPAKIMHDLQRWSEEEVCIKHRGPKPKSPTLSKNLENTSTPTQPATGAKSKKTIEIIKDKVNARYKGVREAVDKNTKKRLDKSGAENNLLSNKGKECKNFRTKV